MSLEMKNYRVRAQEMCEWKSSGPPWLPVPNKPYGISGRKAPSKKKER